MARLTREESAARTRGHLLDAAEVVFARDGFDGASLEKIAETAGYSRGAVYANYSSKADLFLALLDRWLEQQTADGVRLYEENHSARDLITALRSDTGNRFADKQRYALLTEFRLYAMRNPEVAERLARVEHVSLDLYQLAISETAQRACLDLPVPAEQLALMVLALENGIAALAHLDPERVPHHAFLDTLDALISLMDPPDGRRTADKHTD